MKYVLSLLLLLLFSACDTMEPPTPPNNPNPNPDPTLQQPGALAGRVTDLFSSGLGNVRIQLQGPSSSTTTTDTNGQFAFSNLPAGSYNVTATHDGFEAQQVSTTVRSAQTASLALQLKPQSLPSAAVVNTRVLNFSSNTIDFEVDLAVVDADGQLVSSASFDIEDATFTSGAFFDFTAAGQSRMGGQGRQAYSATLLLDQSGSIIDTDPNDARIQASKIFLNALGSGDNAIVSAFASGGGLPHDPVTVYGQFTGNGTSFFGALDDLATLEAGGTPLYQSTLTMLNYTQQNAPNQKKAVIVFTDGEDTNGGATIDDIATRAAQTGVQVYTVGLSTSVDFTVLGEIAHRTGGAFIWASDARQLVSAYGTLGGLLSGEVALFRTRWRVQISENRVGPGYWFSTNVHIKTSQGERVFAPFYVRIPSTNGKRGDGDRHYPTEMLHKVIH